MDIDVSKRSNIKYGMLVEIVDEKDKETQELTRGFIQEIISKESNKKGIKVRLTTGEEGRIKKVITIDELKSENFKFWNIFFYLPKIYSIWDSKERKYIVIDHLNKSTGKIEKTALLFENASDANEFKKTTKYKDKNFRVNEINRKKRIYENFKTLTIDCFRVNLTKKINYDRFVELEEQFLKM